MSRLYFLILSFITLDLISAYKSTAQSIVLDSSKLPICIIETRGKTIVNEPRIRAYLKVINNGPGNTNYTKQPTFEYNNSIDIEIRGNSSQAYPQKQYGFELKDSLSGDDIAVSLLGMPEEEDWILYAPYNDVSLLRNVLTYHLWSEMGHWAPRTRYCELILNGSYKGIYILVEKIKRDKNRVDIAKMNPEDTSGTELTGGYIMKIDKSNNPGDKSFVSSVKSTNNSNITWLYDYPDPSDIKLKQQDYIRRYIDSFEKTLVGANFDDPIVGYRRYISTPSFIDYLLLTEFTRNADAYKASSYFHKEKQEDDGSKGQLKAGPVWDYNFAYGNASFCSGALFTGWMYNGCVPATLPTPVMWRRLLEDPVFANETRCRYQSLRNGGILDTSLIFSFIDKYAADTLMDAMNRHFKKWPILGTNPGGFNAYVVRSYSEEIGKVKSWIWNRLQWMDANLGGSCAPAIAQIKVDAKIPCSTDSIPKLDLKQPFDREPFNYTGREVVKSIPTNIVRWVLVELRDNDDSTKLIAQRAALLRSDNIVVDTNFKSGVYFNNISPTDQYKLMVRYDVYSYILYNKTVSLPISVAIDLTKPITHKEPNIGSPLSFLIQDTVTHTICVGKEADLDSAFFNFLPIRFDSVTIESDSLQIVPLGDHAIVSATHPGDYIVHSYLHCPPNYHVHVLFKLKVLAGPMVEILGPKGICPGSTVELIANSKAVQYLWNTGINERKMNIQSGGLFQVTVTDENACTASNEINVESFQDIAGDIIVENQPEDSVCAFYFKATTGMNSGYHYIWNSKFNQDTFYSADPRVNLTVIDSNQCEKMYTALCQLTTSSQTFGLETVQVIPNPNLGTFTLVFPDKLSSDKLLSLYSVEGKILFNAKGQERDRITFDLKLPPGIYIIQLTERSGLLWQTKMVVVP